MSVAIEEDLFESDGVEVAPFASTATSLERRRAVLLALGGIKASATEAISKQNTPILTKCRKKGEWALAVVIVYADRRVRWRL